MGRTLRLRGFAHAAWRLGPGRLECGLPGFRDTPFGFPIGTKGTLLAHTVNLWCPSGAQRGPSGPLPGPYGARTGSPQCSFGSLQVPFVPLLGPSVPLPGPYGARTGPPRGPFGALSDPFLGPLGSFWTLWALLDPRGLF